MAAVDFYCSEHTIPQSYTCGSNNTTVTVHGTGSSANRQHSISNKLTTDCRRLPILLEQEQRFMPNAFYMQKSVNEAERMDTLETVLQIEASVYILLFLLYYCSVCNGLCWSVFPILLLCVGDVCFNGALSTVYPQ